MDQYFKIGKLAASFGLKGDLVLQHSLGTPPTTASLKVIFIEEKKGSFLPFFIESITVRTPTELLIRLEGIDSKELARKLTPREVWIPEKEFRKLAEPSAPISLLGFSLIDGKRNLGEIIEVIEQPHQLLCAIMIEGKEVLVPIHQESLKKIDAKQRKIHVELPDGLLDIYLL
ncbi:MAG: ribosome maturation factor RimM [Ferruginibacter sp.]